MSDLGTTLENPVFNVHDLILILTFVISGILAFFQPTAVFSNRHAISLLGFFYACIAGDAISLLLLWNEHIEYGLGTSYLVAIILVVSSLLKGPALYFYVQAITCENSVIDKRIWVHAIPVAIGVTLVSVVGINSDMLKFDADNITPGVERALHFLWYFIKLVPVVYGVAIVLGLRNYTRLLKDRYSTIGDAASLWLNSLVVGFLCSWVSTLLTNLLGNLISAPMAMMFGIADNYVTFLLIITLFTYSISHMQSLQKAKIEPQLAITTLDAHVSLLEKVQTGIFLHKLYLNQSLTIEEFSKEIDAPYREVSSLINKHFNTNFFEFINFHRIEEAKRMLSDPTYSQLSILEILHESGFNSKSAFQRFFKRLTGISPREYRRRYCPSPASE